MTFPEFTTARGMPLIGSIPGTPMPGWDVAFDAQSNALDTGMDEMEASWQQGQSVDAVDDIPTEGNWRGRLLFVEETGLLYLYDGLGWWPIGGKLPYFFGSRTYSAVSAGSVRQDFITTTDHARGITMSDGEMTFQTVGIYKVEMSVVWEANEFGQRNLGIDGTDFVPLGPAVNYMFPVAPIQVTQAFSTYISVTAPGAVARPYIDQNSLSALDLEGFVTVMWVSA